MHHKLTKNLNPHEYTPKKIIAGLGTHKIRNITLNMVLNSCGINNTGKCNLFHIK